MSGGLRDRLERLRQHAASVKQAEAEARLAREADEAPASAHVVLRPSVYVDEDAAVPVGQAADDDATDFINDAALLQDESAVASGSQGLAETGHSDPVLASLGVVEQETEQGSFLLRKVIYPLEYRHGHYLLEQLPAYASSLVPIASRQNRAKQGEETTSMAIKTESLLFLDTETTGLGVGTGNLAFMIGIGYVALAERQFIVEQLLVRHPGEERAMLSYLLTRFAHCSHLVTYNGRTFDWPVLVNRFVLNGWRRRGAEPGHLDFLHPSRALWKNTLPSCKLSRIEEDRLGIQRGHDVPGSLAPELYMQYLSDGNAEHLRGVFIHNERDVLTLVTLAIHFGGLLSGQLGMGWAMPAEPEELFRTAAWLDAHGCPEDAERLFAQLFTMEVPASERWLNPAAARYKRLGRMEEAVVLWKRAAASAERSVLPSVEAHIELAMLYEHRQKDLQLALQYAERALALALLRPRSRREADRSRLEREGLQHRLARIRRKLHALQGS